MSETMRAGSVPERRAPRWMWIALIASLAVNLLVVGAVVSAAWNLRSGGFGPHWRISSFLETLPEERSKALQNVVARARETLQPLRQEVRETRRELARIFESEPLDKNALSAGLTRLVEAEVKLRQAHAELTTDLAESMTAEERRAFVKWHEERRRQRFRSAERRNEGATRSAD